MKRIAQEVLGLLALTLPLWGSLLTWQFFVWYFG